MEEETAEALLDGFSTIQDWNSQKEESLASDVFLKSFPPVWYKLFETADGDTKEKLKESLTNLIDQESICYKLDGVIIPLKEKNANLCAETMCLAIMMGQFDFEISYGNSKTQSINFYNLCQPHQTQFCSFQITLPKLRKSFRNFIYAAINSLNSTPVARTSIQPLDLNSNSKEPLPNNESGNSEMEKKRTLPNANFKSAIDGLLTALHILHLANHVGPQYNSFMQCTCVPSPTRQTQWSNGLGLGPLIYCTLASYSTLWDAAMKKVEEIFDKVQKEKAMHAYGWLLHCLIKSETLQFEPKNENNRKKEELCAVMLRNSIAHTQYSLQNTTPPSLQFATDDRGYFSFEINVYELIRFFGYLVDLSSYSAIYHRDIENRLHIAAVQLKKSPVKGYSDLEYFLDEKFSLSEECRVSVRHLEYALEKYKTCKAETETTSIPLIVYGSFVTAWNVAVKQPSEASIDRKKFYTNLEKFKRDEICTCYGWNYDDFDKLYENVSKGKIPTSAATTDIIEKITLLQNNLWNFFKKSP